MLVTHMQTNTPQDVIMRTEVVNEESTGKEIYINEHHRRKELSRMQDSRTSNQHYHTSTIDKMNRKLRTHRCVLTKYCTRFSCI